MPSCRIISWIVILLFLFSNLDLGYGACETYATKCTTSIGQGIYSSGNEADKVAVPIELNDKQYYYATIQVLLFPRY